MGMNTPPVITTAVGGYVQGVSIPEEVDMSRRGLGTHPPRDLGYPPPATNATQTCTVGKRVVRILLE